MGQIIGGAAKPKRCNIQSLSSLGTPAAGEHILVSSDNSMNAAGQGNFDAYIVGDGTTAATALDLQIIGEGSFVTKETNGALTETIPVKISSNSWATQAVYNANQTSKALKTYTGRNYTIIAGGRGVTYALVKSIGSAGDSVVYADGWSATASLSAGASVSVIGQDNCYLYFYMDNRENNGVYPYPTIKESFFQNLDDKTEEEKYIVIDISHIVFFGRRGAQGGSGIMANSTNADYGKLVSTSGVFQFMCASDYVYVGTAKKIIATIPANNAYAPNFGLCFYSDKDESSVVGSFPIQSGDRVSSYQTYTIDVPSTAKYIRTTWWYIGNTSQPTYPELFVLKVIVDKSDLFLSNPYDETLFANLKGKKLSIIGDSICTFNGWLPSNKIPNYDGASYVAWYPKYYGTSLNNADDKNVGIVVDTWWYQFIKKTGMELLSNASWSASKVCGNSTSTTSAEAGCSTRRISDLSVDGVTPDVIVIWMGINDFGWNASGNKYTPLGDWSSRSKALPEESTNVSTFSEGYALMVSKTMAAYPKAKVFCCTLLQTGYSTKDQVTTGVWPTENVGGLTLDQYNDVIKDVAHALGANLIDLTTCGINFFNFAIYTGDELHPNYQGMRLVEQFIGTKLLELV